VCLLFVEALEVKATVPALTLSTNFTHGQRDSIQAPSECNRVEIPASRSLVTSFGASSAMLFIVSAVLYNQALMKHAMIAQLERENSSESVVDELKILYYRRHEASSARTGFWTFAPGLKTADNGVRRSYGIRQCSSGIIKQYIHPRAPADI
jgi:hypothetical protein